MYIIFFTIHILFYNQFYTVYNKRKCKKNCIAIAMNNKNNVYVETKISRKLALILLHSSPPTRYESLTKFNQYYAPPIFACIIIWD